MTMPENSEKAIGLIVVYLGVKDLRINFSKRGKESDDLFTTLERLKRLILESKIVVNEDALLKKEPRPGVIRPNYYSPKYDREARVILRSLMRDLHAFIGSPGGVCPKTEIKNVDLILVINRVATALVSAEKLLINRRNIEKWQNQYKVEKGLV